MKMKLLSAVLALALMLAPVGAAGALAEGAASARTPLDTASDNKMNNISLAAGAVNGMRVGSGETFSFNEAVGARTKARGYRTASNGRGVNVTGGGVSQVATTLYLALLELGKGVRFDALSTYDGRFKDSYVSDGSLAVITDYSAGTDFRFTNLGEALTIDMRLSGDWLLCDLSTETADFGGSWYESWTTPAPTAQPAAPPALTQTITARIPFNAFAETAGNVRIAADSVYDTTLAAGDVFSFNRVVGPRTEEYGYAEAVNGRGAQVIGGGVAQVASLLWLAVKDLADVEILEKSTYGARYNQSYVASADDAIVTDYKAGRDFSFRYNGTGTLTLYTYVDGETLRCDVVRNG